jgi:site-specific DNA-methyltransferase (adenine-specific)
MEINKIYNEDCLETMKRMPDNFVDLTVTSPPYDNIRNYNGFLFNFENTAKELFRITKEGGVIVWIVGDATINGSETGTSFKQALFFKEIGFNLHDTMIYEKQEAFIACLVRYNSCFEYMFIFSKGKPKSVNLIKDRKNKYFAEKHHGTRREKDGNLKPRVMSLIKKFNARKNIWLYGTGKNKTTKDNYAYEHPAMFPENLVGDHIKSWSNEKDLVYDPFMGSGTTAKMAKLLNRNYIGSEISFKYCEIIKKRLAQQILI